MAGPYGGNGGLSGAFPVSVSTGNAVDGSATTFLSLPTGSFVTVGFSSGFVFDGVGDDLFIGEIGSASELANIWISSDSGANFTFLGIATTATTTSFDLGAISFLGMVNAVKIVGLDSFGGSPGFDLTFVKGLEGSVVISTVPLPPALLLFGSILGGFGFLSRKRLKKSS